MQVVMELAAPHHRAALRRDPGRGPAGRDPAESAGAGGLSQDMSRRTTLQSSRSSRSKASTPSTARATSCTASRSRSARARSWACSAATASARARRSRPSWASSRRARAACVFEGKPIAGLPPHKLARLGIGYVPEDRRIFKLLTVMENLRTGLDRPGVTEAQAARSCSTRSSPTSRASPSGATRPAARCRAASSRCWRSPGR